MTTYLNRAAKREANVARLEAQLDAWSQQLNAVLARTMRSQERSGGRVGESVSRVRIDGLRARHTSLQTRLTRFETAGDQTWGTFQADISGDWQTLELALEDLS